MLGDTNGNDFAVPVKDITMEGGKSYRLNVTSNGGKEYKFMAPEFFRNIWMNQIVINHLEIHPYGAPHHIEFDDAGTISLEFVPIRTGTYPVVDRRPAGKGHGRHFDGEVKLKKKPHDNRRNAP